jgi:hypothetical protein
MRTLIPVLLVVAACGSVTPPAADGGGDDVDGTPLDPDGTPPEIDAPLAGGDVKLVITDEPGPGNITDYMVAYRDGDGPWNPVGVGGGFYEVPAHSGRYQVAIACFREYQVMVRVYGFTFAEQPALVLPAQCAGRTTEVRGNVFVASQMMISTGDTFYQFGGGFDYAFMAEPGVRDVLAGTYDDLGSNLRANGVTIVPTFDMSFSPAQLDFDVGQFAPPTAILVNAPAHPDEAVVGVESFLVTATATLPMMRWTSSPPQETLVIPGAHTVGALNWLRTRAVAGDRITFQERWITGDEGIPEFPESPLGDLPSINRTGASPYPRYRATWPAMPDADALLLDLEQLGCGGSCYRTWSLLATPAFVAAGGALEVPDLTAVDGWFPVYGIEPGESTTFTAFAYVSTRGASGWWDRTHNAGDAAVRFGRWMNAVP